MVPSKKLVNQGYAPQLPLEGVILTVGGFSAFPARDVENLSYWHVTGGTPAGEVVSLENPRDLITLAERGVRRLLESFLGREVPFYACPDPDYNAGYFMIMVI